MLNQRQDRRPEDWPVYWFAKLELAVEHGDHAAAAEIQRQLERLGVLVRYGLPISTPLIVLQGVTPDAR